MTQSVIPGGVVGPTGPAGPTGPQGAPGASTGGTSLAAATSVGATSITLNSGLLSSTSQGNVAIDPFTADCEVRRVGTVTGTTVTLASPSGGAALERAHADDAPVLLFYDDHIPASWFGCAGDGSSVDLGTDDSVPLQWAMYQTSKIQLALDGQNRTYMVSIPMLCGQSQQLRSINFRVKSAFAPVDPNGAILMNMQGIVLPFTAAASTDVFTAAGHNLPGTDVGIVFKLAASGSMPGGIVAGRVYYVRDITATTFKVAATRGGAAVNVTSDGSGNAYTEVLSQQKVYFDGVFVNGRALTGINGVALSLQQPTYVKNLRCDNINTGTGLTVIGQEAVFTNFEAVANSTCIAFENASFFWFFGCDFEQQTDRGLHVRATPQIFAEGGAFSCMIDGLHCEMQGGSSSKVMIDFEGPSHNIDINNVNVSASVGGQRMFWVHTGSAGQSSYRIRGVTVSGASGISGIYMLDDEDRGLLYDSWDEFRHSLQEIIQPGLPSSQLYADPGGIVVPRTGNGYTRYGGQNNDQPSMQFKGATNQTGELTLWRDKSAVKSSWVNKDGYYITAKHSAPADADLAAGELALWFDQTNGAGKLMAKGKTANGTVATGSVTLT